MFCRGQGKMHYIMNEMIWGVEKFCLTSLIYIWLSDIIRGQHLKLTLLIIVSLDVITTRSWTASLRTVRPSLWWSGCWRTLDELWDGQTEILRGLVNVKTQPAGHIILFLLAVKLWSLSTPVFQEFIHSLIFNQITMNPFLRWKLK